MVSRSKWWFLRFLVYILSGQTFDRENKRGGAVITIKGSGLLLATLLRYW